MEPISEEGGVLQEWSPETGLLQQIPLRVQKGIFSKYLNLTCVDVVPEYIALGTNCGLIYWYCRATNELQRLRLENSSCTVTCVKIVSTVDYMVAGGTDNGNITVFQIPKTLPESASLNLKQKKNQVERFTINGLHTASVTSIEWSQNGMRLFSGDKNGTVVLTEIDFYMHISKSMELLNEQFEIVQLKYSQQILLISTTFRSIICDGHDKWKVHQVGTKERKILSSFGATFCNFDNELVIYVSRPGQRLWLATLNGAVQKTLIFKTAISSSHPKIQLINPVNKIQSCDTSFGKLVQFGCNKLIVYNSEVMYVLHPDTISIVTSLESARRIIDLAVNDDEIFILEGERSLLRIGYAPNKFCTDSIAEESPRRMSFILDDLASKLKDTALESFKKITSELVITPEPTSPVSPPILADEALDLPPIINLPAGSLSAIMPDENVEIHFSVDVDEQNISEPSNFNNEMKPNHSSGQDKGDIIKANECNEVLSRPLRRRNSKKNKIISVIRAGQESESDITSNASDDRLTTNQINEMSASGESSISFSQSQSSFSILRDISTLLTANASKAATSEYFFEEASKNVDNNSQISLDTCESVSENLKLTPERFLEEQEKTFFRLANQEMSFLDKYNSEKTDNMSVSLNMTPSSSVSSKISDSGPWISEISENISMVSETKTESSQNEFLPLPKQLCFYNPCPSAEEDKSDQEVKPVGSACTSLSCETCHELSDTNNISSFDVRDNQKTELGDENVSDVESNITLQANVSGTDMKEENRELKSDCDLEGENSISAENEEFVRSDSDELLVINLEGKLSALKQSDHWLEYPAPGPVVSLAVANAYVACIDSEEQVYFSKLTGLSLSWNSLTYEASWISATNNGSTVWILNKKNLFSLVDPSEKGPFASDMLKRNSNVRCFALDNKTPEGWLVTTEGQIKCQTDLTSYGELKHFSCDWIISSVACWNSVVLALTSEGGLVCKPPNEEKFRDIASPKPEISYVALGPDHLAWVVDNGNDIYFSDNFLSEMPHWWQIIISDCVYQRTNRTYLMQCIRNKMKSYNVAERAKSTMVAANSNSVWIFDKFSRTLRVNKTAVTGYIWDEIPLNMSLSVVKWQSISANSISETGGQLWLLSSVGDLFGSILNSKDFRVGKLVPVPSPEVRCISASMDVLWLLSVEGDLYARLGLDNKYSIGNSWKELNLSGSENLRLTWISCGCNIAWSCDSRGRIFATSESPYHITSKLLVPVWVTVEGHPKGAHFEKVFVGPNFCMVWAIDNSQNVYFREGISPHNQTGTSWVLVAGLQASVLTISRTSVWALSPNGFIYRRYGVTETNYMGDYWRRIPGTLSFVTSTFSCELYGIDQDNKILKLRRKTKVLASNINRYLASISFNESDDEWKVAEGFN